MKKLQILDDTLLRSLKRYNNTCVSVKSLNKSLRSIAKHRFGIKVGSRKMIFRDDSEIFKNSKDRDLCKDTMSMFLEILSGIVGFECTYRYLGIEEGSAFKPCIIIEKEE